MKHLLKICICIIYITPCLLSCKKQNNYCTYSITEKVYKSSGQLSKTKTGGEASAPCSKGDYYEERIENVAGCDGCDNTSNNDIVREYRKK